MIDILYKIMETLLPFSWVKYEFMKNAMLAVIMVTPIFALMGTMIISKHMVFFSDVLGHSALTGIAIGVVLGMHDTTVSTVALGILLAIIVVFFKGTTHASSDTILGVFFAVMVALGIVILSRGGGFAKYSSYLVGDILAVSREQIYVLAVITVGVLSYWVIFGNKITLVSVNSSLALSRGINVMIMEISFAVLVAVIVALSIRLVGILIINSLLILPAAGARNISGNMHRYTLWAVIISVVSGVTGLIVSYYLGTASGATIVLFAAFFYCATALFKVVLRHR